ncbi:MAG: hypothetical protein ACRYF0_00575 [Janthinobacterium lividum]
MLLTTFLQDLLTTGAVTLPSQSTQFEVADEQAVQVLLHAYYLEDMLDLPHAAPTFEPGAAQWAAAFLYRTVQLVLVRELDDAVIARHLSDYPGPLTPEVLYSVDLSFRYLPDLLVLAKGLAPADALVARLQATARQWPFSFASSDTPAAEAEATVLAHPALRQAYIDRIIRGHYRNRANQPHLKPLVQTALGSHAAALWPEFAAFTTPA